MLKNAIKIMENLEHAYLPCANTTPYLNTYLPLICSKPSICMTFVFTTMYMYFQPNMYIYRL